MKENRETKPNRNREKLEFELVLFDPLLCDNSLRRRSI
jgi:hypothetical protein